MRLANYLIIAFAVACGSQQVAAQARGDASAGFSFASEVCAQCHAVRKGDDKSPNEKAPPFAAVANTRGMTEMALSVWLQTAHPTMPNIALTPKQKNDVIAYIQSMKDGEQVY